jgi:hypothetical protein
MVRREEFGRPLVYPSYDFNKKIDLAKSRNDLSRAFTCVTTHGIVRERIPHRSVEHANHRQIGIIVRRVAEPPADINRKLLHSSRRGTTTLCSCSNIASTPQEVILCNWLIATEASVWAMNAGRILDAISVVNEHESGPSSVESLLVDHRESRNDDQVSNGSASRDRAVARNNATATRCL